MKKSKKIFGKIVLIVIAILLIGFSIFLYFHGNTKPYEVPQEVSNAIQEQKVDKASDEVRIMSSNLLVSYPSWHSGASREKGLPNARPRAKMYYEVLDTYKPDVIGLQEVCDMWFNCLLRHDGPYKFVNPAQMAFTVQFTGLMYNSDTTTLIESGQFNYSQGDNSRLRLVIWGLFEDKTSGKQYIVTSTHLSLIREDKDASLKIMQSQTDELIKFSNEMKEKYNLPIYHTGDFNAVNNVENWKELYPGKTEEEYEKMEFDQAPSIYEYLLNNFTDTALTAKETSFNDKTTITTPVYDHIFQNGDTEISRFVSISSEEMHNMSDHFSIFIDAKLV